MQRPKHNHPLPSNFNLLNLYLAPKSSELNLESLLSRRELGQIRDEHARYAIQEQRYLCVKHKCQFERFEGHLVDPVGKLLLQIYVCLIKRYLHLWALENRYGIQIRIA